MKRKLDDNDMPTIVDPKVAPKKPSAFNVLGLDSRLLQAVAKQDFFAPTLVQSRAIPLVLEGKDVLGTTINFLEGRLTDRSVGFSSLQDWFWQDCCIHPSNSPIDTPKGTSL